MDDLLVDEIELYIDEEDEQLEEDLSKPSVFPAVVVSGLVLVQEVKFLQTRFVNPESSLPLFVEVDGAMQQIGNINMTLDSLLQLISLKYQIKIYKDEHNALDAHDPAVLLNFAQLVEDYHDVV